MNSKTKTTKPESKLPPGIDKGLRALVNQYHDAEVPFEELSRIKQDRLLKAVNKDLKRRGIKEKVTRKDMLVKVYWEDLSKVGAELALTVDVSLRRVTALMDHKLMPKEVKESKEYKEFAQELIEASETVVQNFEEVQALHKDDNGEYRTGVVRGFEDEEDYMEIFEAYSQIGDNLTQWLQENQERLNRWVIALTTLLKNKLDEIVPPPPVEPLVITDDDIKESKDEES